MNRGQFSVTRLHGEPERVAVVVTPLAMLSALALMSLITCGSFALVWFITSY